MNSCASRAHTSNFHFARRSGSDGSLRAVAGPRAIPRDTSETRGTTESERTYTARHARNRERDPRVREADTSRNRREKGKEKQERSLEIFSVNLVNCHRGVAWIREKGKHDRSIFIDLILNLILIENFLYYIL